jgi:peptidoglycan/xylan/chitin deacetylase (PgdA/CDA1 family)
VSAWTSLVPVARELRKRRSLILSYHGVAESNARVDPEFLRVSPAAFRGQLDVLLGAGFRIVTVAELARAAGGQEPPPGLVALSFDDGMDDNYSDLLPILREYGVPATVYVATGLVGQPNPWMAEGSSRMMTEDELRELHAAGVELGAHTVTHPNLEEMSYDACLDEMVRSRDWVAELTGERVSTFAYPFCKYGPDAARAAHDAGFDAAVTCQWRGSWKPYEMKRVMITGKDGPPSFALKMWELYGPLFHSRAGQIARGATRGARSRVRDVMERRAGTAS